MSKTLKKTIMRRVEIDAGHRLMDHEGKCRNYHGHRYTFEFYITGPELDDVGRIVDFGLLKDLFKNWLDATMDHGMILRYDDPLAEHFAREGSKVYIMDENPTAENIGAHVFKKSERLLAQSNINDEIELVRVVCWETPNCNSAAEY